MYVITNPTELERYNHLYTPVRYCDINMQVRVAKPGSTAGTHTWEYGYIDCRDVVGNNFSYEAAATPNNTFGLGAANIDTVTADILYSSPRSAILDDIDVESGEDGDCGNAEIYIEIGYGYKSPYNQDGTFTNTTTKVPLGTFVLQDKTCKVGEDKYTLKLQSLMTKFDKDLPAGFSPTSNTVMSGILQDRQIEKPDCLALLEMCCQYCKRIGYWDSLGTWHSAEYMQLSSKMDITTAAGEAYVASIPNLTGIYFDIPTDSGYLTFRDIIKDVATICGCFATMDAAGGLLLIPFAPMEQMCLRLNDGTTETTAQPSFDICTKYQENLGIFKIREIRCRAEQEDTETGEMIEVNYDAPVQSQDYPDFYDITGTKLLKYFDDKAEIQPAVMQIYNNLAYKLSSVPNYQPVPFDIETAAADFRLQLGDWVCARSNFKDRLGNNFFCIAQIMRVSFKLAGKARYQSFTLPTDNDRNASKRQSGAEGDFPTDEGGEAPPPPEPPVIIFDNYGQWLFGDEDAIREEYEAVGEPGKTYHVSIYGQWSFGSSNL